MTKTIINSVAEFLQLVGEELGVSDWIMIDQKMINGFAEATRDHQWIHVDSERAQNDSSYKSTIAHGYLTLSLIPSLLDEIIKVNNTKQLINYSIEKFIFNAAVPVNSKLRMAAYLKSAKDLGNICMAKIQCLFQIEGQDGPVADGTIVFLYYFK